MLMSHECSCQTSKILLLDSKNEFSFFPPQQIPPATSCSLLTIFLLVSSKNVHSSYPPPIPIHFG